MSQPNPAPTPEPNPAPNPEPQPAPQTAPPSPEPPKSEDPMARERRRADAEKRRADELQKQIDDAKRAEAEAKGEWERVAAEEKSRADAAEAEASRIKAERTVERIASRPNFGAGEEGQGVRFINPDEALALLPSSVDLTDESAITQALDLLASERPHLLARPATPAVSPPPSGGPTPPAGGDPPRLTREALNAMNPSEVQKLLASDRRDEVIAAMGS